MATNPTEKDVLFPWCMRNLRTEKFMEGVFKVYEKEGTYKEKKTAVGDLMWDMSMYEQCRFLAKSLEGDGWNIMKREDVHTMVNEVYLTDLFNQTAAGTDVFVAIPAQIRRVADGKKRQRGVNGVGIGRQENGRFYAPMDDGCFPYSDEDVLLGRGVASKGTLQYRSLIQANSEKYKYETDKESKDSIVEFVAKQLMDIQKRNFVEVKKVGKGDEGKRKIERKLDRNEAKMRIDKAFRDVPAKVLNGGKGSEGNVGNLMKDESVEKEQEKEEWEAPVGPVLAVEPFAKAVVVARLESEMEGSNLMKDESVEKEQDKEEWEAPVGSVLAVEPFAEAVVVARLESEMEGSNLMKDESVEKEQEKEEWDAPVVPVLAVEPFAEAVVVARLESEMEGTELASTSNGVADGVMNESIVSVNSVELASYSVVRRLKRENARRSSKFSAFDGAEEMRSGKKVPLFQSQGTSDNVIAQGETILSTLVTCNEATGRQDEESVLSFYSLPVSDLSCRLSVMSFSQVKENVDPNYNEWKQSLMDEGLIP
jgi:hypothetical protein